MLSCFKFLLPLPSGVTIQFGDSSSGMVAWRRVWRALVAETIQFMMNPFCETASVVPGMCQTSLLGAVWCGEPKPLFILLEQR